MRTESNKSCVGHATVLMSGGIDSMACAQFLIDRNYAVQSLFVDYGQPAADQERLASTEVAARLGVAWNVVSCQGAIVPDAGEAMARNLLLVTMSLANAPQVNAIALGIHSGTPYYDCSEAFMHDLQRIVDGYSDGRIRLLVPFLDWNKGDIIRYCESMCMPIELTYSCEKGMEPPCGNCASCKDRIREYGPFSTNITTQT